MAFISQLKIPTDRKKIGRIIAAILSIIIVLFEVLPTANTINITMLAISTTSSPSSTTTTLTMMKMKELKASNIMSLYGTKDTDDHNVAFIVYRYVQYDDSSNGADDNIVSDNRRLSLSNESNKNKNKKFIHSSLRIEEDVLKTLQEEAQRRGISFNNLVNKTLKNYVTSEMYFEQLGFILVGKDFLRQTFSKVDEKHVEEFGREIGLTIAKEYITCFSGQVNNNTLIQFLDIWFRRFQFCQHRVEDIVDTSRFNDNENPKEKHQLHLFTVIHDINLNFSLVLKALLEGLVEPITKSSIKFRDITSTSITFLIKL